jgi:hypothetical protein
MYNTFRSTIMAGLLIVCFGAYYSSQVLELYTGTKPAVSDTQLLQIYGVLFILQAVLTITESFSFAIMNTGQILK